MFRVEISESEERLSSKLTDKATVLLVSHNMVLSVWRIDRTVNYLTCRATGVIHKSENSEWKNSYQLL
jgi:hypothetical protein